MFFRTALVALAAAMLLPSIATAETLSFGKALKLAKQRSPELREAQSRVVGSEANISLARSAHWPSFGSTFSGTESGSSSEVPAAPPPATLTARQTGYSTNATAAANLRWTLYDFGRTGNQVNAAEASRDSAVASASDAEASVLNVVANAYLDVVYGEKTRDIQKGIVDDREKSLAVVKALVKQGLSPAVEELRSRSRIESARRDLETSEADLIQARVGLLAFLGLDPKSEPTFTPPRLPRTKMDTNSITKEAEESRPGLAAARAAIPASEAAVDVARARYYPVIGVNGDASYGFSRPDSFGGWLNTRAVSAGLVVSVPIWDPANSGRVDAAKAEADRVAADYELQVRDARTEAARTVVTLQTSDRILEHAKKASEASSAVLAVMRARFAQGLTSMIDLIDAETTDAEARLAEVTAERGVDASILRLYTVTGRFSRLYDVP